MKILRTIALASAAILLPLSAAPVSAKPGETRNAAANARSSFNSAARDTARRVTPVRLPYRAIPTAQQRAAARPRIMAEQIHKKAGKNRVSIRGTGGRSMVTDVAARRPNGERHYNKATGTTARLPHVRNDRTEIHTAPSGKRFARTVRGETREATISDLRTTRRFVESRNRARAAARRMAP